MIDAQGNVRKSVFGLDIGTRSIVGTVGYMDGDDFIVVSQKSLEHETRAMLDGQIHDIRKVGETIRKVKVQLEEEIGESLKEVCIAAAGRVLRTVTTHAEIEFPQESVVTEENVYELASVGIEKAYDEFLQSKQDSELQFYCVGYSIIRYYMNGYVMNALEEHKANTIGADLIATFLPDDVVDGLYRAVEIADLEVAHMTLEPIAAIGVAIPERFRMLNIALVDVGAGTSDISITKEGSIIAYGMIPIAGDALTEVIAQHCLVDFAEAEKIKRGCEKGEEISYVDIMGLPQTIQREEVLSVVKPVLEKMTKLVADKIRELNGDKSVSAVFVVGGGGKLMGYTDFLADELSIQRERVAVRGEEVMQKIHFMDDSIRKDSLLVTPVGICLSFYEQSNNFIFVNFNGSRIKLYDNNHLVVLDVAMQAKFPNDRLFPRRGKELNYRVNGSSRFLRGELGEAAVITVNGQPGDMYTPVHANDVVQVEESTAGKDAGIDLGAIPECKDEIHVEVNGTMVTLPKFASVNGNLQSEFYSVHEGDEIVFLPYYTVKQIIDFMDVILDYNMNIYVNNKPAGDDTKVYDNFSVIWTFEKLVSEGMTESLSDMENGLEDSYEDSDEENSLGEAVLEGEAPEEAQKAAEPEKTQADVVENAVPSKVVTVLVNGSPVTLEGKEHYVYVDVFDRIDFDLTKPKGAGIVTNLNGRTAQYMEELKDGDSLDIYWLENNGVEVRK